LWQPELLVNYSQHFFNFLDYNVTMKLLVVEDEQRIATYLKKGLELKSHVVDTAADGESGLDLALTEEYDVIILDRMLPNLSGVEVCHELRQQKISTPILMLTAKSEVADKVSGLDAGADDYLTKPFSFEELLARVNALARRPSQLQENILQFDSLTLDPRTGQVERDGKTIELSKKEFALLEFLLRHPNQLFSADQLTQQVWSFDSDVTPNSAQVYLGYLRKKIDKPFSRLPTLIHTVRGFGYKLGL
jgi:DNA-binding response OmpR family regulator